MGNWFPSCADASVLSSSSATDGWVESGLVFQDETPVVTLSWGEQAYFLDVNELDGGTRYKGQASGRQDSHMGVARGLLFGSQHAFWKMSSGQRFLGRYTVSSLTGRGQ